MIFPENVFILNKWYLTLNEACVMSMKSLFKRQHFEPKIKRRDIRQRLQRIAHLPAKFRNRVLPLPIRHAHSLVHCKLHRDAAQIAVLGPQERDGEPRPDRGAVHSQQARAGCLLREMDKQLEPRELAALRDGLEQVAEARELAPHCAVRKPHGQLPQRRQAPEVDWAGEHRWTPERICAQRDVNMGAPRMRAGRTHRHPHSSAI